MLKSLQVVFVPFRAYRVDNLNIHSDNNAVTIW